MPDILTQFQTRHQCPGPPTGGGRGEVGCAELIVMSRREPPEANTVEASMQKIVVGEIGPWPLI